MNYAIEANGIEHKFGLNTVLNNIHLQAEKGEMIGLLGPSGAGKTTLIKILTGQLLQTAGIAKILGIDTRKLSGENRRKIGIMMDQFGLYERLSCYDNLKLFAKIYGVSQDRLEASLRNVGLEEAKKTAVMNLSKGMKNRLLLARALMPKPFVLFLDEPTSGLDPTTTAEIHQLIQKEQREGLTVFLTTHNMSEAEKLCDQIALLHQGRIIEYGNPQEICRNYNHQKKIRLHLYDGSEIEFSSDASAAKAIAKYLEQEKVETIHSTEPNLETVFMELTGRGLE